MAPQIRPTPVGNLAAGHRWTRQREAIVDVLRTEDTHLDASEIFEIARRRDRRLSLSTVYRTLSFLRDFGVVRELRLGEGHSHYEIQTPDRRLGGASAHHSHLVCRACGLVIEFRSPLLDRLRRGLDRSHGFAIDRPELELSGLCRSCRPHHPIAPPGTAAI